MRWVAVLVALVLVGCTDHARIYPLDDAALRAGIPKFEFVRTMLGSGPVTVTMPDGEILKGEYQVTDNTSVGFAFSGAQSAVAIGHGSGRPVAISAVGNKGTIMNCEAVADVNGNGSGVCRTNKGNNYRVMF